MTKPGSARQLELLCVDDEPDFVEALRHTLAQMPFQILTADSVPAALKVLDERGSRIVGIVSDLNMPAEGGFDLRRKMLERFKDIPFIVLSGFISREIALEAVDLKVSAFIDKPFDTAKLMEIVTREVNDRVKVIREDDELLDGFVAEASQLIEEVEGLILNLLDSENRTEVIDRIFACVHTIKGASGYFKPDSVHRFAHKFEDYLSTYKKNPLAIDDQAVSVSLKAIDTIKSLVADLDAMKSQAANLETLLAIFTEIAAQTAPDAGQPGGVASPKTAAPQTGRSDSLRVSLSLLDTFMERSGEITVLRNMINKVVRVIELEQPSNPNVVTLGELLNELHRANGGIQDQIADLRKVQLRQVFKPLTRTLRDLCVALNKKIRLEISGEDLRVDHTIAEILSKCLVHMVRNAVDHGIEGPEARQDLGKPPEGLLKIEAEIVGEDIRLTMSDDGRGVDAGKVRAKAVEKGIIAKPEADRMNDDEARMLIFHPGFSTAEQVTDVSGRGVGTDMVKKSVESVGGRLNLKSEVGKGTQFTILLPVPKSVLIISSLLVRAGKQILAVPRDTIARVTTLDEVAAEKRVQFIKDCPFFDSGYGLVPILDLNGLLGLSNARGSRSRTLVMIACKHGSYCLEVDEILDIEDTVVKAIGPWLEAIGLFSGATFLGDGRVGLILDVEKIGASSSRGVKDAPGVGGSADTRKADNSVLLFSAGGKATYGIHQKDLFRLEEIERSRIQNSGSQSVIIYRGEVVPVVSIESLLDENHHATMDDVERIPLLMVKTNDRFVALAVRHIDDFVQLKHEDRPKFTPSQFEDGWIIDDRTVTVLKIHDLLGRERTLRRAG